MTVGQGALPTISEIQSPMAAYLAELGPLWSTLLRRQHIKVNIHWLSEKDTQQHHSCKHNIYPAAYLSCSPDTLASALIQLHLVLPPVGSARLQVKMLALL